MLKVYLRQSIKAVLATYDSLCGSSQTNLQPHPAMPRGAVPGLMQLGKSSTSTQIKLTPLALNALRGFCVRVAAC